MVKLSSFLMDGTYSQQRKVISRKRKQNRQPKQKQKEIDGDVSANKQNSMDDIGIDKLSDDMLINILSRMNLKEAARTSVLSRRWKYLWIFAFGTLEFDDRDTATGTVMKRKNFKSWVNSVLKFYQPLLVDSLIIRFSKIRPRQSRPISRSTYSAVDSWIYFAMQNEVQRLGLDFSPLGCYDFPNIEQLLSHSHEVNPPFRSLRSLRLVEIDIEDEMVQHFLASCCHLEELCIRGSSVTKNLQVVDPPNLQVLEVSKCLGIQSLEISAVNLVSLTYKGRENTLLFKKIPNLCELTLGEDICDSFIFEPHKHSSYSVQLVKLGLIIYVVKRGRARISSPDLPQLCSLKRLELRVSLVVGRSLLFFTPLIKASPQLREFRIEILYMVEYYEVLREIMIPAISAAEADKFDHENLEVVEMAGYVGCSSEEEFLRELYKISPSLKRVVIDTESDYYDDPELASLLDFRRQYSMEVGVTNFDEIGATTRIESKERAQHLVSTFPLGIEFVII